MGPEYAPRTLTVSTMKRADAKTEAEIGKPDDDHWIGSRGMGFVCCGTDLHACLGADDDDRPGELQTAGQILGGKPREQRVGGIRGLHLVGTVRERVGPLPLDREGPEVAEQRHRGVSISAREIATEADRKSTPTTAKNRGRSA